MTTRIVACPGCGLDLGSTLEIAWSSSDTCPACGHGQTFLVETISDVHVVHLKARGLVTEQNVMRTLERVRFLIDERHLDRVLVDFEGVTYLSSTVLARLINLARQAKEHRAQLKLCSVRPDVRDIFRITRLEGHFDVHDSTPSALQAFLRPADIGAGPRG